MHDDVGERQTGVAESHLKDFEVVLRFFYQVSDGKVHPLSVPGKHETNQKTSDAEQRRNFLFKSS